MAFAAAVRVLDQLAEDAGGPRTRRDPVLLPPRLHVVAGLCRGAFQDLDPGDGGQLGQGGQQPPVPGDQSVLVGPVGEQERCRVDLQDGGERVQVRVVHQGRTGARAGHDVQPRRVAGQRQVGNWAEQSRPCEEPGLSRGTAQPPVRGHRQPLDQGSAVALQEPNGGQRSAQRQRRGETSGPRDVEPGDSEGQGQSDAGGLCRG